MKEAHTHRTEKSHNLYPIYLALLMPLPTTERLPRSVFSTLETGSSVTSVKEYSWFPSSVHSFGNWVTQFPLRLTFFLIVMTSLKTRPLCLRVSKNVSQWVRVVERKEKREAGGGRERAHLTSFTKSCFFRVYLCKGKVGSFEALVNLIQLLVFFSIITTWSEAMKREEVEEKMKLRMRIGFIHVNYQNSRIHQYYTMCSRPKYFNRSFNKMMLQLYIFVNSLILWLFVVRIILLQRWW